MAERAQIHLTGSEAPDGLASLFASRLRQQRHLVVALDGPSGAGKSTLAGLLRAQLDAAVLEGDSFFAGGVQVRPDSPERRARDCIDWRRQRSALKALRAGNMARYRAFDWKAFDGRLECQETCITPKALTIVEGVYSARPELADLVCLRVLLETPASVRTNRLLNREGAITPWERQWHEAEQWYFTHRAPATSFDVRIR